MGGGGGGERHISYLHQYTQCNYICYGHSVLVGLDGIYKQLLLKNRNKSAKSDLLVGWLVG